VKRASGVRDVETGEEGHTLGLDDVFASLVVQRRRTLVHALAETEGSVPVETLVERIVAWEAELGSPPPNHRERVAAAVRHAHLPKLVAVGLVEFDERSDHVRFHSDAAVEEWLEHAAALSVPGSV